MSVFDLFKFFDSRKTEIEEELNQDKNSTGEEVKQRNGRSDLVIDGLTKFLHLSGEKNVKSKSYTTLLKHCLSVSAKDIKQATKEDQEQLVTRLLNLCIMLTKQNSFTCSTTLSTIKRHLKNEIKVSQELLEEHWRMPREIFYDKVRRAQETLAAKNSNLYQIKIEDCFAVLEQIKTAGAFHANPTLFCAVLLLSCGSRVNEFLGGSTFRVPTKEDMTLAEIQRLISYGFTPDKLIVQDNLTKVKGVTMRAFPLLGLSQDQFLVYLKLVREWFLLERLSPNCSQETTLLYKMTDVLRKWLQSHKLFEDRDCNKHITMRNFRSLYGELCSFFWRPNHVLINPFKQALFAHTSATTSMNYAQFELVYEDGTKSKCIDRLKQITESSSIDMPSYVSRKRKCDAAEEKLSRFEKKKMADSSTYVKTEEWPIKRNVTIVRLKARDEQGKPTIFEVEKHSRTRGKTIPQLLSMIELLKKNGVKISHSTLRACGFSSRAVTQALSLLDQTKQTAEAGSGNSTDVTEEEEDTVCNPAKLDKIPE